MYTVYIILMLPYYVSHLPSYSHLVQGTFYFKAATSLLHPLILSPMGDYILIGHCLGGFYVT